MDGTAVVYAEGAFNTTNGKTAHGLVRFTTRYHVVAVIDSVYAGKDARDVLDGIVTGIPVVRHLEEALTYANTAGKVITHFVIGLAPDGGRMPAAGRQAVREALARGLNVDSGLHDFLSDDPELLALSVEQGVCIRDIRKPPARDQLNFFSGKIEQVNSLKIAVLGTDSAIGKRTTAWILVHALRAAGIRAELIGTGQTAWMQGARYGVIMDTLINDFVSGEIEHAIWLAWHEQQPDVLVIEGQGSLMNPAYPGGFEILAAGRPDMVILQHAPRRREYDGFPGYPIQSLPEQIHAIEAISGHPVVAITLNHENMDVSEIPVMAEAVELLVGLPAVDALTQGADRLVHLIRDRLHTGREKQHA